MQCAVAACLMVFLGGIPLSFGGETYGLKGVGTPLSSVTSGQQTFSVYPFGAVLSSGVWHRPGWTPSGDKPIEVCWENLADSDPVMRQAVRDSVAKTWAQYGMVSFVGWGACEKNARGIRIEVDASESSTVSLGQHLDGVPKGMRLQMDFSAWPYCKDQNEFCVRATAVHEFGHALAFAHEQNRKDAPAWCKAKHSGDFPDLSITKFDPESIMNYCNKEWNNKGLLSEKDIEAVTKVYGARS
ncbi:ATPase [Pseudomonas sp. B6002]|uniref:ATPase n=1 Tax=Pseudomonas sp. B6002 TaxID=2726978 RepID=UPI0015A0B77D|nr:ATPase [Pseudomonas sp. B6002]NVZ51426.1 ATPase [Pseudomonas sp. B6002]